MRRILVLCIVAALLMVLALGSTGKVLAGQPNQSCQAQPSSPGNASAAPGSAFNEDPGGVAGVVYAGTPGSHSYQNSNSLNSVSQYDVACYQVSTNPGH